MADEKIILQCRTRQEFRQWLMEHHDRETECWVEVRRGRPDNYKFRSFPPLYQRIRAYNVAFYKQRNRTMFNQTLAHLIEETKKGRMFGEWNDYGRLLDNV